MSHGSTVKKNGGATEKGTGEEKVRGGAVNYKKRVQKETRVIVPHY
jgi:hypothetical protein